MTGSEANNEQIRIDDINLYRKLLLYIDLVQVYNLHFLHSFVFLCYANADFATRLHYVYEFVFVYVFV